jgi:hypothetical protein
MAIEYIYKYNAGSFSRVLRYLDGSGWYYQEAHTTRSQMHAGSIHREWLPVLFTPERLSPREIKYMGDIYRLSYELEL